MNARPIMREYRFEVERMQIDISPDTWRLLSVLAVALDKNESGVLDELVSERLQGLTEEEKSRYDARAANEAEAETP